MHLAIARESLLLGSAALLHLLEMLEKRPAAVGVVKAHENVSAGADESLAATLDGEMTIVRVMQHADGNYQIKRHGRLVEKQIGHLKIGIQFGCLRNLASPFDGHGIEVDRRHRAFVLVGQAIAEPAGAATDF